VIIRNVQALRALAANGVMISHLLIVERKYGSSILPAGAQFGAFGVDLFFVISGFIMATIAREGGWASFLISRARRILPPYWLYTTIVLLVSLVAPAVVNSSLGTPPSLWRSYLLIPDVVPPLLAVGWTMIHESYFYLVFGGMLFLMGAFGLALPILLLVWATTVICLNHIFRLYGVTDPVAAVVAHPLTLEFIFGAVVGILIRRGATSFGIYALLAGASLLAIALLAFPDETTAFIVDKGWARVLVIGLPYGLIVYGVVALERLGVLTAPAWLVAIGDASYSTYLSHVLVLSAFGRLFAQLPNHNGAIEAAFIVACTIGANAVGLVSARLIERRR
jgi:exopolysaccharide production protein ExoZ